MGANNRTKGTARTWRFFQAWFYAPSSKAYGKCQARTLAAPYA